MSGLDWARQILHQVLEDDKHRQPGEIGPGHIHEATRRIAYRLWGRVRGDDSDRHWLHAEMTVTYLLSTRSPPRLRYFKIRQ